MYYSLLSLLDYRKLFLKPVAYDRDEFGADYLIYESLVNWWGLVIASGPSKVPFFLKVLCFAKKMFDLPRVLIDLANIFCYFEEEKYDYVDILKSCWVVYVS